MGEGLSHQHPMVTSPACEMLRLSAPERGQQRIETTGKRMYMEITDSQ